MTMRFWHRPLRAMMAALHASGFSIQEIAEPDPRPSWPPRTRTRTGG